MCVGCVPGAKCQAFGPFVTKCPQGFWNRGRQGREDSLDQLDHRPLIGWPIGSRFDLGCTTSCGLSASAKCEGGAAEQPETSKSLNFYNKKIKIYLHP